MEVLPPALVDLLQDSNLIKYGVNVNIDATWIFQDFQRLVISGHKNIVDLCRKTNAVPHLSKGQVSLESLYATVVGRYLAKPIADRRSNWDGPLTESQRDYAALDCYAVLDIYHRVRDRKQYGKCLLYEPMPAGTEIYVRGEASKPHLTGVLLDKPDTGVSIELEDPPLRAGDQLCKRERRVQPDEYLVAIQRVDRPTWKAIGYNRNLQHVSASVENPFTLLLPASCLYTRPPLADPRQLPPPDQVRLEGLPTEPCARERLTQEQLALDMDNEAEGDFEDLLRNPPGEPETTVSDVTGRTGVDVGGVEANVELHGPGKLSD